MPWVEKPKKDVIGCEKPRSGASNRDQPGMSEWGNLSCTAGCKWRQVWEVKYLSTTKKRNRKRFPQ